MKTTVLLINLGTPDSPKTSDVRKYLTEFLNDKRVIDLPWLGRKSLVNAIIVPFRSSKSAKLYSELWTEDGSPLLINAYQLQKALSKELGSSYEVELAMRYGKPSLKKKLKELEARQPERIILVPLYPQYASSTTGSTLELAMKAIARWKQLPEVKTIHHFHDQEGFIDSFADRIKHYKPEDYDHVVMSYHGLPLNQVTEAHQGKTCEEMRCEYSRNESNHFCYRASCYETSHLLAEKLQLKKEDYTVCFQSRLNKNWTSPFTDEVVLHHAQAGKKKLLVTSPAFVADCLETIHELGTELKRDFEEEGGAQLTLVESLNVMPKWVETLANWVNEANQN